MKAKTKRIGGIIRQRIHEVNPNARVMLYGFRARGEERVIL